MKKSTLLSLLTATSIVLTTAGTYATWDSITATTNEVVTFRKPVTVTVTPDYELEVTGTTLGTEQLTASGTVAFTVSNEDKLAKKLKIVPQVSGGNASVSDFNFTIKDGSSPLTGDALAGFVDSDLTSTTYTVEVSPNNTNIAGQEVSIQLTATLSE